LDENPICHEASTDKSSSGRCGNLLAVARPIGARWSPLVAEVEWHAGHRGFERPVAVRVGGRRLGVTVESSRTAGPGVAGLPARRVFFVRDRSGRRLRIEADASGDSRVAIDTGG
jgi:hypothetical protein